MTDAAVDGLPAPRRYWAIFGVWLALTAAVLDGSFIALILPTLARELNAEPAQAIWVINSFQLAVVVSLLPLAALGERIAYRNVFLGGLAVFAIGSGLCLRADTLTQLACVRALQGFGAAGLMSVNGAMLRYIYPSHLVGRAVGLNAMIIAVFGAVGPGLAALVLEQGSWRWLFAINVAIASVALVVGYGTFPVSVRSGARLDGASIVLNVMAFGLIVAGVKPLMQGTVSMLDLTMIATGAIAGCILIARSCSQSQPLFPLDLLRVPLIAWAAATSVGAFAAQMLAFIVLPFYFESEFGVSPLQMGAQFMVWCAAVAVVAPVAGQLSDRFPAATLSALGLALFAAGLAALALLSAQPSAIDMGWRMTVCGVGFALFQAPNNRALLSFARPQRLGAAAGIQAMARTSGQILGALAASCFLGVASSAWRIALGAGAAFATMGALASVLRFQHGREG